MDSSILKLISSSAKKLDSSFKQLAPETDNNVDALLKSGEKKIGMVSRSKNGAYTKIYDTFDEELALYLTKVASTPAKKFVSNLFSKKLVFIGCMPTKNDIPSLGRVLITTDDKFAGVVLNSYTLNIDLSNGEVESIDDAFYAIYSGLIRSAVILNKQQLHKDIKFNSSLISSLYYLFLRILGRKVNLDDDGKKKLAYITGYLYYRHFYQDSHAKAMSIVLKGSSEEETEKYSDFISSLSNYSHMKDVGLALYSSGLIQSDPKIFNVNILHTIESYGFYSLNGSLDGMVAFAILSGYPTNLVTDAFKISKDNHKDIESTIDDLLMKMKYSEVALGL